MTVYLALSPEAKHYHYINPLGPDAIGRRGIADGHEPEKWTQATIWWIYVVTVIGWGVEVIRAVVRVALALVRISLTLWRSSAGRCHTSRIRVRSPCRRARWRR